MTIDALPLLGAGCVYTRGDIAAEVEQLRRKLTQLRPRVLALDMDNCPEWAIVDLAALDAQVPLLPLPPFFSVSQRVHALHNAGVNWLIADAAQRPPFAQARLHSQLRIGKRDCALWQLDIPLQTLPAGTAKITYTSGTTGEPKGVCLSASAMGRVGLSLVEACELSADDLHLSALPLSTLLENIGGLYAQSLAGARAVLLPMREVGLAGMSAFDPVTFLDVLDRYGATTTIVVPQMLQAMVRALEQGSPRPKRLRFLAVGGAPLSESTLHRARECGLPAYQGYGLSECASVVCLNTPKAQRAGSVGKVLNHASVHVASDGELHVNGATLLGYAGDNDMPHVSWPTGDIGRIDSEGYVFLEGRRRDMLVTSYGRNVAPSWIESELLDEAAIAQAVVFGEGRPYLCALIVSRNPDAVAGAIERVNARLPDYARVRKWRLLERPLSADEITPNGRPRRERIAERYARLLQTMYVDEEENVES